MISREVKVTNSTGLHARPASLFVGAASKFKSSITITKDTKQGNAKSILSVLSLAITNGSSVTISAEGEDAAEAVETLVNLIKSKFGEA